MMSLYKVIMAVIVMLAMSGGVQANPAYQICTAGGRQLEATELAELVKDYDVIVFGEYHDNAVLHKLEAEMLINAFAKQRKLAVSLEMFERDVQNQLDDYLAGKITEEEFLANSRPWKNYREDYRPLVQFAKNHSLPVLAANIPRPLAAQYAKEGSLATIADNMKVYLPKFHLTLDGAYREKFIEYMTKSPDTGKMPGTADKAAAYYKAQCLKDDTMAESIAQFQQAHADYKIIHFQGDFHSRYRLGVVEKLQMLNPELAIAVITPVYVEEFGDVPGLAAKYKDDGDIIIFVQQPVKKVNKQGP